MPSVTGKVEGKRMKKILIAVVPFMLAGCSYYNQFVERMQTDTLEYQCDQKPLTVHRNNIRQQVSFIYDNQQLNLAEGLSASGARYTDGVYVFWSKGDTATVYKRDRIILDNCQLQTAKR